MKRHSAGFACGTKASHVTLPRQAPRQHVTKPRHISSSVARRKDQRDSPDEGRRVQQVETSSNDQVKDPRQQAALAAIAEWSKAQQENEKLSLPPFLLKDYNARQKVEYGPYGGVVARGHELNTRLKRKYAPFAAHLSENVWAKMLAEPIREERLSQTRVPRACLIAFHPVDMSPPDEDAPAQDAPAQDGEQKPQKLHLHPRTLLAEMFHKKELARMSEEKQALARDLLLEKKKYAGGGGAIYLLASYHFLQRVSERDKLQRNLPHPSWRTEAAAKYGRRVTHVWPLDTPDLVLQTMRKVLAKKLGHLLRLKKTGAEQPGMVQAPIPGPDGGPLLRLRHISDVVAVVRLKPAPEGAVTAREAADERREHWNTVKMLAHVNEEEQQQQGEAGPEPDELVTKQTAEERLLAFFKDGEVPAKMEDRGHESSAEETRVEDEEEEEEEEGDETDERPHHPGFNMDHDYGSIHKYKDFMKDLKPLPPPTQPSNVYYPMVPYWNCRVPVYNLPMLLGDELAAKITEATVFEDTEYVAIRSHGGTAPTLEWLWKLHTFIGEDKSKFPKI